MFLITGKTETRLGMRLSGIEGVVLHEKDEIEKELEKRMDDEDLAVIMLTHDVVEKIRDKVNYYKLNRKSPLLIEIPDRHGNGRTRDSITKYVEDAIGIKIR